MEWKEKNGDTKFSFVARDDNHPAEATREGFSQPS